MQRRRKKKTAAKKSNTIYDKSLPSLPPSLMESREETLTSREYSPSPDVPALNYVTEERPSSRGPADGSPAQQPEQPLAQGKTTSNKGQAGANLFLFF